MNDVSLAEAQGGRARVATQLAAVQARRPARGADASAQAAWLRDKAGVHEQIAGYLRRIGDTAGAVEADMLATRCRVDACDLIRDEGTVTTILGPCPGYPVTQSRSQSREQQYCLGDVPPAQRTDHDDRFDDRPDDWIDEASCRPGLR